MLTVSSSNIGPVWDWRLTSLEWLSSSRDLDLDLASGSYGIPSCITHRPLSTYQMSLKSEKTFCGRTKRRDPSKFKVTWHKNRTNIKNLSVSISGHLPAPSVNGGDRLRKVQFSELQKPVTLTLDRVIRHTVLHRLSTSMYTPNFIEIGKSLWTDGRTDGHFRPPQMLLGRLGVDLQILHNSNILCMQITLHHCSQRVSLDKQQQQQTNRKSTVYVLVPQCNTGWHNC